MIIGKGLGVHGVIPQTKHMLESITGANIITHEQKRILDADEAVHYYVFDSNVLCVVGSSF